MVGHLLRFHPAFVEGEGAGRATGAGAGALPVHEPPELRQGAQDENALWSLARTTFAGAALSASGPARCRRAASATCSRASRTSCSASSASPSGMIGAPARVVARPAQAAHADGGRHRGDGGLRRHRGRPQGDGLREGRGPHGSRPGASSRPRSPATRTSRHPAPTSRCSSRCAPSSRPCAPATRAARVGRRGPGGGRDAGGAAALARRGRWRCGGPVSWRRRPPG